MIPYFVYIKHNALFFITFNVKNYHIAKRFGTIFFTVCFLKNLTN